MSDNNEVLVDGFTEEDFSILQKILENYKVSIKDEVSIGELYNIHKKVVEINDFLKNK